MKRYGGGKEFREKDETIRRREIVRKRDETIWRRDNS